MRWLEYIGIVILMVGTMVWGAGTLFLTMKKAHILRSAEYAGCYPYAWNPTRDCWLP